MYGKAFVVCFDGFFSTFFVSVLKRAFCLGVVRFGIGFGGNYVSLEGFIGFHLGCNDNK